MALSLSSLWQQIFVDPHHVFLATPQGSLTYASLAEAIRSGLRQFDEAGLIAGDRVLIRTGNETAAIVLFTAAILDGLVPVMLAPGTPDERMQAISNAVEPGLVCQGDRLDEAPAVRAPRLPVSPDDLAYILFTSGTTQSPSGVSISRHNLLSNVATLSRLFGYDAGSRIFNDMVLAHADGFIQGPLMALANGATVIRSGGFTLQGMEAWLERVRETRSTHVITVPTVWSLIDRYAKRSDYFSGPDCRALLSVAAKLDSGLWQRLEARFGRPVFNQYGLTETVASALYAGPHPEMGATGTIGKPVDCAARIIDVQSGIPASSGEAGELQLRGNNVFPGYWKDPARTAECFTDDGWFRTGDLARLLPDGSHEILGRIKTIIMMAGFLIRPEEIDEAVASHPAVAEAVTVAVADPEFGEIPVTAVVVKSPVTEAEITAHARRRLEPLKVPKRIALLPEMPRGISGKPDLTAIRRLIDAESVELPAAPAMAVTLASQVIGIASRVFRIDAAHLTLHSAPATVPGWDSFSHITLLLAAEDHFGIEVAAVHATDIKCLDDLVAVIASQRGVSAS